MNLLAVHHLPTRTRAGFAVWLLLWLLPAAATAQDSLPVNVGFGHTAEDRVFGYGQDVHVEGTAEKAVVCVRGDVYVKGTVVGDISVLSGNVHLAPEAVVEGDIFTIRGTVNQAPGAKVHRVTSLFPPNAAGTPPWRVSSWSHVCFYLGRVLVLFLLVALVFYSFPNQVNEAGFQLSQDPVRAAVIGAVSWAALAGLFILSFLLMVVGVGFIIFMFTLAAVILLAGFGTAVVLYQLAVTLEARLRVPQHLALLLIVPLVCALGYVPLLGETAVFLIALFGVGIAIETRFGTNKQWFTRKARYWAA